MTINLKSTFVAANVVLDVVCRSTKKSGIFTFIRTKTGKAKAVLGCRTAYTAEQADDAKAAYEALVKGVEAKGWTLKSAGGASKAGRFTEIPDAPTADVVVAEPVAPKKPKAPKK